MKSPQTRTIAQTLFRSFLLFSTLWIGGLGLLWLAQLSSHFSDRVEQLEARALARHQAELRNQVEQALNYIDFMRAQVEERTRTRLRERVELAHRAASVFVARNQDRLPPEALRSGLRELLRSMSGDPGRPYLFAMDFGGVVQLFPPFPDREGRYELDALDGQGQPVNRRLLALARDKGRGFHRYSWVRPGGEEPVHDKLSFVMAFEPLNWFIGAGEYLSNMETAVRRETLRRIESIRFGEDGYVFAGDWTGASLSGPAKGRNMLDVTDADGVRVVQELIRLSRGDGGWLTYRMPPLDDRRQARKMSYVRGVPEWEWYVGAGVYLDEIDAEVALEKGDWRKALFQMLAVVAFFLLLSLAAALFPARRLARSIGRDFEVFNRFFLEASEREAAIVPAELRFWELRELAEPANQMVARRREAEQSFRESEERLRSLIESAPDAVFVHDLAGRIRQVNKTACAGLGYDRETLLGMRVQELEVGATASELISLWEKVFRSSMVSLEGVHRRRDGTTFPVEVRAARFSAGEETLMVGFVRDIGERKAAEAALRESEERFALALKGANDGLWDWNLKTNAIHYSPRWKEMLGYDPDELPDRFEIWEKSLHPEDLPEAWRRFDAYMFGRTKRFEMEFRMRHRNGHWVPILSRAFKQLDATGEPVRLVGTHVDLTPLRKAEAEKERLEAQLRQSQKMEAVGQLAGGVAHDFNNLLQVITGHLDLALADMAPEEPAWENLDRVARAGRRATRLVSQLLAFSRRQVMEPEPLNLNEVIAHLLTMLGRVIGEHIRLDFTPASRAASIRGDRGMLEQVLLNLCVNARDAMEGGGRLALHSAPAELDDDFAAAHPWARPGRFVRLEVTDTGRGMTPEIMERIFEPFFTTKETGKGTGLGLATVYGIVKQHEGMIQAYSEPGRGTTFSLFFPRVDGENIPEVVPVPAEIAGGTETILLAEDNDLVRELAIAVLEKAGYTVFATRDGVEALDRFRSDPGRFDLLLLDVVMPRTGGREVYEGARAVRPGIPAVFTSGYSEDAVHNNFALDAGLRLVRKPFTQSELLSRIRYALDAAGKPSGSRAPSE